MKCKKCGNELNSTANFCEKCGTKVEKETTVSVDSGNNISNSMNKKSIFIRYRYLILVALLIVSVIIFIYAISRYQEPSTVNIQNTTSETFNSNYKYDGYQITEEYTTQKPTENPTEKPTTEPPTEKPTERKIINNTSTDGFWAEGSGDYVTTDLNVTDYGILHIEYYGEGHFSVISYEGDNYDDLLVNTVGGYSGDVLVEHSGTFNLEISATGNWKISSSGLTIDDTTSFSGNGDFVTGITSHSGGVWEITHSGEGHFSVIEYGLNEGYIDLLANDVGNYNGTVKVESGDDIFFKVSADGNWSIKKK